MSREIKFRAWSKFPKMFLDMDDACYYLLPHGKLMQITRNNQKPDTHRELDVVVQLYTGLKDSKEREIYEGDIVEFLAWDLYYDDNGEVKEMKQTRKKDKVIFKDGKFMAYLTNLSELLKLEVVGNIYENKDLLDGYNS